MTMRVYIKKVDEGYGLFWEDGMPIYDDDSDVGGLTPIKVWKRRGWAARYAAAHEWGILECAAASKRPAPIARHKTTGRER